MFISMYSSLLHECFIPIKCVKQLGCLGSTVEVRYGKYVGNTEMSVISAEPSDVWLAAERQLGLFLPNVTLVRINLIFCGGNGILLRPPLALQACR